MDSGLFWGMGATLQLIAFGTYFFFCEERVHGMEEGEREVHSWGWSVDKLDCLCLIVIEIFSIRQASSLLFVLSAFLCKQYTSPLHCIASAIFLIIKLCVISREGSFQLRSFEPACVFWVVAGQTAIMDPEEIAMRQRWRGVSRIAGAWWVSNVIYVTTVNCYTFL